MVQTAQTARPPRPPRPPRPSQTARTAQTVPDRSDRPDLPDRTPDLPKDTGLPKDTPVPHDTGIPHDTDEHIPHDTDDTPVPQDTDTDADTGETDDTGIPHDTDEHIPHGEGESDDSGGFDGTIEDPLPPDFAFVSLEAELPLALLPIRIEARYYLDEDPPELRLRFFPDAIHADGHADRLTQAEQDLGRAFWRRTWRAGGDTAGEDAAFAWLAEQIGPWRAAWVAGRLRPANPAAAPKAPVPDGRPLLPPPLFPAVETLDARGPTRARLLPERFAVFGYHKGKHAGTWWGEHIPEGLPMAPGLAEAEDGIDGRGLLAAQGLAWTFDFEEAEKVGMALRIDLSKVVYPIETDGFSELQVLGVCVGDQREALEELLEGHRYTHGLDFIPQGTPTNSTETAAAGAEPRSARPGGGAGHGARRRGRARAPRRRGRRRPLPDDRGERGERRARHRPGQRRSTAPARRTCPSSPAPRR